MKIQAIALLGLLFAVLLFSITSSASAAQKKVLKNSSHPYTLKAHTR